MILVLPNDTLSVSVQYETPDKPKVSVSLLTAEYQGAVQGPQSTGYRDPLGTCCQVLLKLVTGKITFLWEKHLLVFIEIQEGQRQSFKFRRPTALSISYNIVSVGTFAVLFHRPCFKFKTKRQNNGVTSFSW